MVDERGFDPPASSLRTVGKISEGKAPQSLSYFHEALNWQTWQTGFLFVFPVQFDGEKPDKITRGACACNDDKVIFENPLNWTTRTFIFAKQREYENGPPTPELRLTRRRLTGGFL